MKHTYFIISFPGGPGKNIILYSNKIEIEIETEVNSLRRFYGHSRSNDFPIVFLSPLWENGEKGCQGDSVHLRVESSESSRACGEKKDLRFES